MFARNQLSTFVYLVSKITLALVAVSSNCLQNTVIAQDIGPAGYIQKWNLLGPYTRGGGPAPGVEAMRMDYLTDGTLTETNHDPVAGDTINTDFALAASDAIVGPDALNPGGVPTWNSLLDNDGYINFNNEYYDGNLDNVMMYAVTYVHFDSAQDNLALGVGSDDSIQVLIDDSEAWINSVARGNGPGGAPQDIAHLDPLSPGVHKIMVKIFEGGGGHNFKFRFQDQTTGEEFTDFTVVNAVPEPNTFPVGMFFAVAFGLSTRRRRRLSNRRAIGY